MAKDKYIGLIVASIILLGVIVSSVFIFFSYRKVIFDSTRSISELSAMNIYSEINNELTKPIYVSLTMANDSFVKSWLATEETDGSQIEITQFLEGIQSKYGYSSVFLVSATTLDYYHYTGFYKTVNESDDHDVWYYDFIQQDELYLLDVDVDQASGELTIFINAKLFDEDNNLSAVVGVGVEMTYVQELIGMFEEEFGLEAFLIDDNGLVQSHTKTNFIETRNIFDEKLFIPYYGEIITNVDKMVVINEGSTFIISRYVDELDWHILVVKDTNLMIGFIRDYFLASIFTLVIVLISVIWIVQDVVDRHQKKVLELAKTDHLTLLLNRRGFDMEFAKIIEDQATSAVVFMIDIDGFKKVNDQYGHVVGDDVLRKVAKIIDQKVRGIGKLSRWGGDEFTGILVGDDLKNQSVLESIRSDIESNQELTQYGVSISIGYTITYFKEEIDAILNIVDNALYKSKALGGNKVSKL
ncbi:MAG: diguanylate cyclase [Bacilli bacterium]|nr:diguanylate cyclase [Bacilli bacterium]